MYQAVLRERLDLPEDLIQYCILPYLLPSIKKNKEKMNLVIDEMNYFIISGNFQRSKWYYPDAYRQFLIMISARKFGERQKKERAICRKILEEYCIKKTKENMKALMEELLMVFSDDA